MKKKLKNTLFLIAGGILLFALGFAVSWWRDRPQLVQLNTVEAAIQKEQASCATFVNGGSGDFNRFSYCQGFVGWINGLQTN